MDYKIIFSESSEKNLENCLNYYSEILRNPLILKKFFNELDKQLISIKENPYAFALMYDEDLAKMGIRKAHLKHYNYKILYKIVGEQIHIEAILHDLQDYTNILQ